MSKTPFEIAEEWYSEHDIARAIKQSKLPSTMQKGLVTPIPEDIYSPEFARWLTTQYRLAMSKGIQIGRSELP